MKFNFRYTGNYAPGLPFNERGQYALLNVDVQRDGPKGEVTEMQGCLEQGPEARALKPEELRVVLEAYKEHTGSSLVTDALVREDKSDFVGMIQERVATHKEAEVHRHFQVAAQRFRNDVNNALAKTQGFRLGSFRLEQCRYRIGQNWNQYWGVHFHRGGQSAESAVTIKFHQEWATRSVQIETHYTLKDVNRALHERSWIFKPLEDNMDQELNVVLSAIADDIAFIYITLLDS